MVISRKQSTDLIQSVFGEESAPIRSTELLKLQKIIKHQVPVRILEYTSSDIYDLEIPKELRFVLSDKSGLNHMAVGLSRYGLFAPIYITADNKILDGIKRYYVYKEYVDIGMIPTIKLDFNESNRAVYAMALLMFRDVHNPTVDYSTRCELINKAYVSKGRMPRTSFCSMVGISDGALIKYLQIAKFLPEGFKKDLASNKVSFDVAYKLSSCNQAEQNTVRRYLDNNTDKVTVPVLKNIL